MRYLIRCWWLVLVMVIISLQLTQPVVAHACSIAPNGFVFVHEVAMEDDAAPPYLSFEQESASTFALINGGGAPIYVLADPDLLSPIWEEVSPPHDFASLIPPDRVIGFVIQPGDRYLLGSKSVQALLPGFDPNQYYDESTPEAFAGLSVPDPVSVSVTMVARDTLYDVPLTISYRRNPNYHPTTLQEKANICQRLQTSQQWGPFVIPRGMVELYPVIGIGGCSLLALAGSITMLVLYRRRRK